MNALIIIYACDIMLIYIILRHFLIIIIIDVTLLLDISIIYLYKICMIRFNKINNIMIEVIIIIILQDRTRDGGSLHVGRHSLRGMVNCSMR